MFFFPLRFTQGEDPRQVPSGLRSDRAILYDLRRHWPRLAMLLDKALRDRAEIVVENLPGSGLAYLLARQGSVRPLLVLTKDADRADEVASDLVCFGCSSVAVFPGDEGTLLKDLSADPRSTALRLGLRHRIVRGERPQVILAAASALLGRWMPEQEFLAATASWAPGDLVERDELLGHFVRCGYQRVNFVEDEGTFAVRGGIVDLFLPGATRPVRIDLFGDEIASIKTFEPESQRTCESLDGLAVYPIREVLFSEASVARAQRRLRLLADEIAVPSRKVRELVEDIGARHYFYGIEALWPAFYERNEAVADTLLGSDVVTIWDDAEAGEASLLGTWQGAVRAVEKARERHQATLDVTDHLVEPEDLLGWIRTGQQVRVVALADDRKPDLVRPGLRDWQQLASDLAARREDTSRGEILDVLEKEIRRRVESGHDLLLVCSTQGNAERLRELLLARRLDLPIMETMPPARRLGGTRRVARSGIVRAGLSAGLLDPSARVALLTDREILGTAPRRARRRRRVAGKGLSTLENLHEGDLVIHVDHGIGRYLGLKRLIVNGLDGDFALLEYAGADKLYVPVYRLNVLQRYSAGGNADTRQVRLDRLGGTRWAKAKQRVRDATLALAHGLLELQAQRKSAKGFAVPAPSEQFRAFEAGFPYEETPDQERAIADVLADLQIPSPMDRLVCGDVGFGKTEVAIRAAYLTVLGGKQVAVLVPTTVLAEQHRMTFQERLATEGVVVEVLSRFRTARETREIIARLRQGSIDVLVGTHKILSADVGFRDLGLLVVDEEQRFGVRHKERIKQLRQQVHVITLTATPIPRTMHMAMVGLRDLSIIQTPPLERTAVRTEVTRFDEELVAEAIRRELRRGGQVFVVHNRVRSIGAMKELVERLVPEARVAMAHGQMPAESLERIMVQFVRREFNVLVCTAIIESGIDIPSANTLIVNRADTFGLSQLYQLRGRIGRGRMRGHAYLLLPRGQRITAEATERLRVLKRFSDLGSGFHIATHDLDIRGAGDLLGADQSGHIAAVGSELFTQLLEEAVERAKGSPEAQRQPRGGVEPEIKLPVAAMLPESYVPEPMRRLEYYQRMAQAGSDEAIHEVYDEIRDLYGDPPEELRLLAEVMILRRLLQALGANALAADRVEEAVKIGISFVPQAQVDRADLARRLQVEPERYRLLPTGRLAITVAVAASLSPLEFTKRVRREVGELKCLQSA